MGAHTSVHTTYQGTLSECESVQKSMVITLRIVEAKGEEGEGEEGLVLLYPTCPKKNPKCTRMRT